MVGASGVVIGVLAGKMTYCRFGLHRDVTLEVLDVVGGARGIFDAPDDSGGNFDGVAALIVDLQPFAD